MSNNETSLIDAERRGRALANKHQPRPGDLWQVEIGSGPNARALAAAARWADRLGAKVERRLALANRLTLVRDGFTLEIRDIPAAAAALAPTLASSGLFVKPVDNTSLRLSSSLCRSVDRKAIEELGVPGLCLMENAALDALAVALDMLTRPRSAMVLVAAGGGNNGGDGLALARMLLESGIQTAVALLKPPKSLAGDAGANLRLLSATPGAVVHTLHDKPADLAGLAEPCSLVVDALLGTGFKGGLSPAFQAAIAAINLSRKAVLALDLPSGLDGDSGRAEKGAVLAARTITFAAVKPGLELADGPGLAGQVYLGDIGAPNQAFPRA